MATVSYTYDIKCNEKDVSQVKIDGADVTRLKVGENDVIHKFVTYKTTATIKCYIRFSSLKAGPAYISCGNYYSDVRGIGNFYVEASTTGDSLSDSGGSIPNVEVYFRRTHIFNDYVTNNHHDTFSNLDPNTSQTFNNFSQSRTVFICSADEDKDTPFRLLAFEDSYSDGSVLRTSWGNVNISGIKYTPYITQNSNTPTSILLGSISKTFTKTVQEY